MKATRAVSRIILAELQKFWHHFARDVWVSVIMMKMNFVSFLHQGMDSLLEVSQLFRVRIDYNCRFIREYILAD